ncbi:hypothetical protein A33Q_2655 [Indibacter alkaliphilus LW1]|uniref:Long-chain fatty acid transport protein n=1 Tax=Indibacter alkaliphilus (strain CCUG 57479 / KCTC 22604 / LW1) TaxID=1189612 RepID=S2DA36_INDAL|nr:hypothetical protein [Indibacter alkaliphilus]EOZ96062.1 hypothetical protein A33Q_2655 [Indibacter alkaliphilus LW1]
MKKHLSAIILFSLISIQSFGQGSISYYTPTHYYGLFSQETTSARSAGMGRTAITMDGIDNAFYNPAAIGLTKAKISTHFNYAHGGQVRINSHYPFAGVTYRVNDRLNLGLSSFRWTDRNPIWTTQIAGRDFSVDKREQTMFSVNAAYEVIDGLYVGASGLYLYEEGIPGSITSRDFIFNLGAIYEKEVDWIKVEKMQNQKIRGAASLVNAGMKNRTEQTYEDLLNYRSMLILLHLGASYHFSVPLSNNLVQGKGFFDQNSKQMDVGVHLQFRDELPGKDPLNTQGYNSSFGVGTETWFFNTIALRMGYYFEKRPKDIRPEGGAWVTTDVKGFTWGYGARLPLHQWTEGQFPFNAEVNLVTGRILGEVRKDYAHRPPIGENNFLFSIGVNLQWVK